LQNDPSWRLTSGHAGEVGGALGLSVEHVSVKAKTNEGMGAIGRGEGMAALAIASLREISSREEIS